SLNYRFCLPFRFVFFFFQAEDGIRDFHVTGVQTCALPIFLFEVMSGFATVGLSRGLAPELSGFGKGVIIVCMFVGRLGPLTLAFILTTRRKSRVQYSRGEIYIG